MSKRCSRERLILYTVIAVRVLRNAGFTEVSQPVCIEPAERYANIVSKRMLYFWNIECDPVEPPKKLPRPATGLTGARLDKLTLTCALHFAEAGAVFAEDLRFNESLNVIRAALSKILFEMGYEELDHLTGRAPLWGCYPEWVALARAIKLRESEIRETRDWFREKRSEHFEEG